MRHSLLSLILSGAIALFSAACTKNDADPADDRSGSPQNVVSDLCADTTELLKYVRVIDAVGTDMQDLVAYVDSANGLIYTSLTGNEGVRMELGAEGTNGVWTLPRDGHNREYRLVSIEELDPFEPVMASNSFTIQKYTCAQFDTTDCITFKEIGKADTTKSFKLISGTLSTCVRDSTDMCTFVVRARTVIRYHKTDCTGPSKRVQDLFRICT